MDERSMVESISHKTSLPQNIPAHAFAAKNADGHFAKTQVRKLAAPSQTMADLQEELSALHSEKIEEKNIEEYQCEDFHDNLYVEIVRKIQEEYPPGEKSQKENVKNFAARLREKPPKNSDDLQQMLAEITEDQGEAFAILQQTILSPPKDLPSETLNLLRTTARDWVIKNSSAIIAGANTISLAREQSGKMKTEVTQLQKTYQDMVCSYEGILPALTKITADQGVEKFDNMTSFIMSAADKDLAATRSSVQPERIRRILAEFQGVKVFHTLREWSGQIFSRFLAKRKAKTNIKPNEFFMHCLKFISAPEKFSEQILAPMRTLASSDKVLVLQGLRNGVRSLPDYLFANAKAAKSRILFPVQNEIDRLVFEQDA